MIYYPYRLLHTPPFKCALGCFALLRTNKKNVGLLLSGMKNIIIDLSHKDPIWAC